MTAETTITPHESLPLILITRDFAATPAQIIRAHTDQDLFVQWIGPDRLRTRIEAWDARRGGHYRYVNIDEDGSEYAFYGSFHEIAEDRLVQTFTFEGYPEGVSLDTMTFEELGGGRTRMYAQSLVESLEARDAMIRSGMEVGVTEGYRKLDRLLDDGAL